MKIIDILKTCAELLGLTNELNVLGEITVDNEATKLNENSEVERLFRLSKFSLQEIATNYFPMRDEVSVVDCSNYDLALLTNYIRMHGVYEDSSPIDYKIINKKIVFSKPGTYTIAYYAYPEFESLFDDLDFLENLSPDALVFSVCSYYSIAKGMFNEFEEFHNKYVDRIEAIKNMKTFVMPARRWEWDQKKL